MISIDEVFIKYKNMLDNKGIVSVDEPFRTIIAIYSVQGILDNGGFEYLFESKFNDVMPIEIFQQSYKNIQADSMEKLLSKAYEKRSDSRELSILDDEMFKLSDDIWKRLEEFATKNGILC